MTAPPPPPPPEAEDPTLVEPAARRRVVVDEGPPPPVVRPYPWWLWVLTGLALAAAAVFLVLWLVQRGSGEDVPSLVGMRQAEAQNTATDRGFTLKVVPRTSTEPQGTVVDQAPQAGASLEEGSQVMAVVSAGREQVTVPQLVGTNAAAAEELLSTQGLQADKRTVNSAKPKGTILAQEPQDGTRVTKGSTVTLSVSSGTGRVGVPAVQGMSQAEAVKAITDAGLVPVVIQVPSQEAEGTVTAQDPAANQKVEGGGKVRINVSGGPAQTSTQTLTVTTEATTTETTATTVTTTTP